MRTHARHGRTVLTFGLALAFVLLFAVFLMGPVSDAHASVMVRLSTDQLEQAAADVFAGQVVNAEARRSASGAIETVVRVRVLKTLKGTRGSAGDTMDVVVPGGSFGGLTMIVDTAPVFRTGEAAKLYLDGKGGMVGGFQGKRGLTVTESALYGALPYTAPSDDTGDSLPQANTSSAVAVGAITPSSGSAGTGTNVTISGSGFGATQGAGSVQFTYRGTTTITAPVVSWSDTQIVCTVPTGTIDGYAASAGSGPVRVTNALGESTLHDFSVTFGYGGCKWGSTSALYRVNANTTDTTAEEALVDAAAATWNAASDFRFVDGGSTTITSSTYSDGVNAVYWSTLTVGILAQNTYWAYTSAPETIIAWDVAFNDYYTWGSGTSGTYDIQTIATHELGHSLNLRDLYGPRDADKIMYGYGSAGQVKRVLSAGDIAGAQWIYGGGTVPPDPDPTYYTLTTSASPSAGGSVSTNPGGTSFASGTQVTLTATPASGYTFSGWSGDASGTATSVTVTMDSNKTVTANFTPIVITYYTLTTSASPSAGGSVSTNPGGTSFASGTQVTLTATPAGGYTFSGWSGDATGTATSVTVTMDSNKTVTANFAVNQTVTTTRYEQDQSYLTYAGTWYTSSSRNYSSGSQKYASAFGAKVTATFLGNAVSYIATKASYYGYAKVTLDGVSSYVSLYRSSLSYRQTVWSASNLAYGNHTLVIEWTGRSPGSGSMINLDALDIGGTLIGPAG